MMLDHVLKFISKSKYIRPSVLTSALGHNSSFIHTTTALLDPHVCIIGGGPAGFYTAQQILKNLSTAKVDILERLPVPFGLVRFGVAPDHPEVKNVISTFTQTANHDRCSFLGNVTVGRDVTISELKKYYDSVVLSYGAAADRDLAVPGENLKGVYPARTFVGWYNGLPEDENLNPDLTSGDTAVIIGQGNVALDIARLLLSPIDTLKQTDITEHALSALEHNSNIKKVYIVGRRGPLQVAFTIKELREMVKLPNCSTHFDSAGLTQLHLVKTELNSLPRPRKRLTELMIKAANEKSNHEKAVNFVFQKSPVEILEDKNGCVKSILLSANRLDGPIGENQKVVADPTEEVQEIPCSIIIKSIGYRSLRIDEAVPFDLRNGIIPNEGGRVISETGLPVPGLYCSGWVRRGPTGVIATTMNDGFETGRVVAKDLQQKKSDGKDGQKALKKLMTERGIDIVTFKDWENLDRFEIEMGEKIGKPREKVTNIENMKQVLWCQSGQQ